MRPTEAAPFEGTADRRLRYSGVPRVVALVTGGNDILLRRREGQSPPCPRRGGRRSGRSQGGHAGRNPQVAQDLVHDLGIGEERQHDHRNGSPAWRCAAGGRRVARTRETFYVRDPAKKLLPGEPSSSRAVRRFGGSARAVIAFLYIRRGCGSQGTPTGRVRCLSRRWRRWQQPAHVAAICEDVISHRMSVRKRHQRGQPSEKVERLEDEGGGPAGMRPPPVPGASGRRK